MAFKHYKQIKTQELPSMNIENVPAFLKDTESNRRHKPFQDSALATLATGPLLNLIFKF